MYASNLHSIDTIFAYFLNVLLTACFLSLPIGDIKYINKVNENYNLEDVSLKLENSKKRKEEIAKELELQGKIHQTKQIKFAELKTAMQNIMEVINILSPVDNFDLTNKQEVNLETKEEGKKLILEKK